jgi:uncharacterized protein YgbK (DUF1537 family)
VIGRLLVAADDRTGALEVAGSCAAPGAPVTVSVWPEVPAGEGIVVVDLGTRDLAAGEAVRRVHGVRPDAVKIDSRLRGNWAVEAATAARVAGRPLWVVAALPAMGRTCRSGVVRDGDTVVGRPAAALGAAGVAAPDLVVHDAVDERDLRRVGAAWRAHPPAARPVLAGLAAALAPDAAPPTTALVPPVVVACGSLHPVARAELAALPVDVHVLATELPADADADAVVDVDVVAAGDLAEAAVAAAGLSARVVALGAALGGIGTLVVVGGATAAAVLGDGAVRVGGLVVPGVPWARRVDGTGPLVVTRSGGFGGPAALPHVLGPHCRA